MNPRDTKVSLAQEIVARFHSQQAARDALASFEARFRDGIIPDEMPEVQLGAAPLGILKVLREARSEEHTSELQSLMRISYAVFCLKKKKKLNTSNLQSQRMN